MGFYLLARARAEGTIVGNARVERMRVDARESGETRRRDIGLTARERYLSNAAMARDAEGARRASWVSRWYSGRCPKCGASTPPKKW